MLAFLEKSGRIAGGAKVTSLPHLIHGTGIFTYMNGWFLTVNIW